MDLRQAEASIARHLKRLSAFTSTPGAGVTRLPFSESARNAAQYLLRAMGEAGLDASMEPSGGISGVLHGTGERRLIVGSHYDSVPNGGAFDGVAGISCGLAIAEQLAADGIVPPVTFELLATNDEEGVRFLSGYFTARALTGELLPGDLLKTDAGGISLQTAMASFGLPPDATIECARSDLSRSSYVEIHVEQGPVLEALGVEIGIVEAIVGIERRRITVSGQADHAGTAPMAVRRDALRNAMKIAEAAYRAAESREDTVATVGTLKVFPGAVNVVPGRVQFSLDVRSTDPATIAHVMDPVKRAAGDTMFETTLSVPPTPMDAALTAQLESACKALSASTHRMNSGAGHDALVMAHHMPAAMLFVPSKGGRSHCPEEWSDCKHLALAAAAVYNYIKHESERGVDR